MPHELTLHGMKLTKNTEIAPNLFTARDHNKLLRVHNATIFLGYSVANYRNRKGESRWGFEVWNAQHLRLSKRTNVGCKTLAAAERALVHWALKLNSNTGTTAR